MARRPFPWKPWNFMGLATWRFHLWRGRGKLGEMEGGAEMDRWRRRWGMEVGGIVREVLDKSTKFWGKGWGI